VAGILSYLFVLTSYAALCTVYSTMQYSIPAVLPKYLPVENKYTEIPNRAKSKKCRYICFLPSIKKYRKVLPKYLPGNPTIELYRKSYRGVPIPENETYTTLEYDSIIRGREIPTAAFYFRYM
jgi:hypothetical protein